MKIIDMKEEFIVADHVIRVQLGNSKYLSVYTSDNFRYTFVFDSREHAKDCFRNLKSFLRNTSSMEDLFSIKGQPGYVEWSEYFLG